MKSRVTKVTQSSEQLICHSPAQRPDRDHERQLVLAVGHLCMHNRIACSAGASEDVDPRLWHINAQLAVQVVPIPLTCTLQIGRREVGGNLVDVVPA